MQSAHVWPSHMRVHAKCARAADSVRCGRFRRAVCGEGGVEVLLQTSAIASGIHASSRQEGGGPEVQRKGGKRDLSWVGAGRGSLDLFGGGRVRSVGEIKDFVRQAVAVAACTAALDSAGGQKAVDSAAVPT
eukprot:1598456-Rhodomonas_salina.1